MRYWPVLAGSLVLAGCGGGDDSGPGIVDAPDECSVESKKQFVWDVLNDSYLWADQMPAAIDLDDYLDEEELLNELRYQPADRYSFITTLEAEEARQSNTMVGLGVSLQLNTTEDAYIVRYAYENSPAWNAGLRRGHQIVALDGEPVAELVDAMDAGALTWREVIKPAEVGVSLQMSWLDTQAELQRAEVVKDAIVTNRVHGDSLLNTDVGTVGYFAFTSFTEASAAELRQVFEQFSAEGVDELILDLRYNGGGRISVAQQLASSVAGENTVDEVFVSYRHNSTYTDRDSSIGFTNPGEALDLSRVIVLTGEGSCSASELVINSLQPFIGVTVIGETTCGKPIGMYLHEFCDKVLYPIEFQVVNAFEEGDYFDGLTPDCVVADTPRYPWGDVRDSQLAAALDYLQTGSCPAVAGKPAQLSPVKLQQSVAIYPDSDL